jgi:hypothetical protein
MSAVATTEVVAVGDAPAVSLVPVHDHSVQQMHAAEQKRWMVWFGIPALIASLFVALTLSMNQAWIMGLAIAAIVVDIFILVWLAMTSDTNGSGSDYPAGAAH